MKKIMIVIGVLLWMPLLVHGDMPQELEEQYLAGGGESIEEYYQQELEDELSDIAPDFSPEKAISRLLAGQVSLTPAGVLGWLGDLLWGGVRENAASFGLLLLLVVLCGAVRQLDSFGGDISGAAELIFIAAMCAVVMEMFDASVRQSREAVGSISEFVVVLAPVMASFLAGSGQMTGAGLLHPVLYGAASFSVNGMNRWMVPGIYLCFLLCVANALSDGGRLEGITGLVKSGMKWILGAVLTVFSGLAAVYSVAGQNVDAMVSRTARFAVGNLVPVVGGMLSESVDLVLSFSSVLRRGVGLGGMAVLLLVFAHTAVSLTVQLWMFRLGAAFAAPLGSPGLSRLLSDAAACTGMMLATLCVCVVLFCLLLIMMITAGGGGLF